MGTIWVREFTGGLNAVKMPETATGGILVKANNGHITRGGEFEQRAAFVRLGDDTNNVAGSIGLAHDADGLVVFGETADPGGWPTGVTYQQLVHPNAPATALRRIHSWDLYAGKIYASAEFADDAVYHFYDGAYVDLWFDGRARAQFTITEGETTTTGATAATGSINVNQILSAGIFNVDHIYVGTTDILSAAVTFDASTGLEVVNRGLLATAIAANVAAFSGTSGYTAVAVFSRVDITATATGTASNRFDIIVDVDPLDVTITNGVMGGGTGGATTSGSFSSVTIDGVEGITGAAVDWAGSPAATATALAAELDSNAGATGFDAAADGATVVLTASSLTAIHNGKPVIIEATGDIAFTPATITISGGLGAGPNPGKYVRTISKKMYSSSGSTLFFTGIDQPTQWTTDATGAGFIDMATEASGSEKLTAFARYQNLAAVFSETAIQLWYFDPDPALNRISQVLENTGTVAGRSVTQFGDSDLFYLDDSGIRSLRARDSSNAAATTDIGIPIDPLVRDQITALEGGTFLYGIGLIEPRDGRFWLLMKNKAFVFSFFPGTKVSAWSTYDLTYINEAGATVTLNVDYATVFDKKVYLRSGNTIFVYGGEGDTFAYDATVAEAWSPYLDANAPMQDKTFNGIDAVARGQWLIKASLNPNYLTTEEDIVRVVDTTYVDNQLPFDKTARMVSLRLRSEGVYADGTLPHKIAALALQFEGDDNED